VCLVIEALSLFSIVSKLSKSKVAAWAAVAFLLTNPSVLYLHTTALTEPVLFAAVAVTMVGLVRWATASKAFSGGEMALFCGLPAAAATMARYDGWAFTAAAGLVILIVAWHRWRDFRYAVKLVRCFATIPVIAVAWWCWFNWINFGDPLEFQRGKYSAQAQQQILERQGKLPDNGDLLRSIDTYMTSVLRGAGMVLTIAAVAGMVFWLWHHWRNRNNSANLLPWLLLGTPFCFYVFSLVTGQVVVRLETTAVEGMFNLRYGVAVIAGLAVFAGLAVGVLDRKVQRRSVSVTIVLVVVVAGMWNTTFEQGWREIGVVAEGVDQRAAGPDQYAAAVWMHGNATTGVILIDDSINPLLPVIDADLNRVAAPFSERWPEALADPSTVDWVFIDTGNPFDEVGKAVAADRSFDSTFVIAFSLDNAEVYRRIGFVS